MEGDYVIELSDVLTLPEQQEFLSWLSRQHPNAVIHPRITPELVRELNAHWRVANDAPNYVILDKLLAQCPNP